LGHRTWPTWVLKQGILVGDWAVDDQYRVTRIFDLDGEQKVLTLDTTLSHDEVHAVLLAIARNRVEFTHDGWEEYRPNLRGVFSIRRDEGRIEVRFGGSMRGKWIAGHLEDDTFLVEARGTYVS